LSENILEEFLVEAIYNKLLHDRNPTEEEWNKLIEKLKRERLIE